jgi:dienelactone hydrolase
MSHRLLMCALLGVCAFTGCSRLPEQENSTPLTLTTSDGYELAATFRPAEGTLPAGVVLVHMLGSDRHAWQPFAQRLQRAGVASIAFDVRGHGDSRDQPQGRVSFQSFATAEWMAALNDIDAAVNALREHGVDPQRIAVIGASIGANLSLNYAADHPDVAAAVLLSPGLEYRGVETQRALQRYVPRPLLLMASEGDAYAAQTCTTLAGEADETFVELRMFPGSAHGTDLLAVSDAAAPQIMQWLELTLGLQPS